MSAKPHPDWLDTDTTALSAALESERQSRRLYEERSAELATERAAHDDTRATLSAVIDERDGLRLAVDAYRRLDEAEANLDAYFPTDEAVGESLQARAALRAALDALDRREASAK